MSETTPPPIDDLIAAGDIQGVFRAGHERRLEREGIPMILGIADERGSVPVVEDAPQRAEGAALERVAEDYFQRLTPWARADDEGAVITTLQVLAMTHFRAASMPSQEEAR